MLIELPLAYTSPMRIYEERQLTDLTPHEGSVVFSLDLIELINALMDDKIHYKIIEEPEHTVLIPMNELAAYKLMTQAKS